MTTTHRQSGPITLARTTIEQRNRALLLKLDRLVDIGQIIAYAKDNHAADLAIELKSIKEAIIKEYGE
jgi:hypothetical protein